ncbi:hypothetical protein TUM4438_43550 [Shewanella sairae]|uniref:DUF3037 domain-containing protein n=1 Tax=Shewanella sairae TaxID=190310 RepID=A0ABQ4PRG2_9GAMM|nr:DUF3037 domain-containing protein [Shewanella sairae]MCL1132463.1 DUF3037 domain-containing protein [Shewanella sairae]GIU52013.1 hypothetical protein TUM4438_43550 [Shewanella sairae]
MKTLLHFATIRFMPFAETQEFANVGILAFTPNGNFVDYKLAPTRFKRINEFFEDFDGQLYACALTSFEVELKRVKDFCHYLHGQQLVDLMNEVTRTREGIIVFGELSATLTENPKITLERLFDKYIGRNFQQQIEYRETQMVRALRKNLTNLLPKEVRYKETSLDVGYTAYKLPLVAKVANTVKTIKPLAFNQSTTLMLTEHGDRWISRVKHLLKANVIQKENFLFTIERPTNEKDEFHQSFEVIYGGMKELGVEIIPYESKEDIIEFAQFDELNNSANFKLSH